MPIVPTAFRVNNVDTGAIKDLWTLSPDTEWDDSEANRTITFMEKPTGYFATWLETNATKFMDKSDN